MGEKPNIDPLTALVCLILLGVSVVLLNVPALIISISANKQSRRCSYPILWMLVANILIGSFPLPIYALKKFNFSDPTIARNICDAWRYTYFTTSQLALTSLIILTADRILVLRFPLQYSRIVTKTSINVVLGVSWICIAIFDAIPFFGGGVDDDNCHYKVEAGWAIAFNVFTLVIPLPIIFFGYSYMVVMAISQAQKIKQKQQVSRTNSTRRKSIVQGVRLAVEVKATRNVAYVVGSYLVCWTPSAIYYLLEWICDCYPDNYEPHRTWMRFFFKVLIMAHALVTPIVFCYLSKAFRTDAQRYLRKITGNKMQTPNSFDRRKSMGSSLASNDMYL